MVIWVSLYPDLSSNGGIKVKATEAATSRPATTKLINMSLRSVTLALMGGATGLEGVKLPRLLLQGEAEDSIKIQTFWNDQLLSIRVF